MHFFSRQCQVGRQNFSQRIRVLGKSALLRIEDLERRLLMHIDPLSMGDTPPMPAELWALAEQNQAGAGTFSSSPFPAISYSKLANGMPVLNSFPSTPAAIFLDFDGDSHSNTLAYDTDSPAAPSAFSAVEQAAIVEAWRQVSVYFAMFNVNVTTIQPAAGAKMAWLAIGNNIVGNYSGVNVFSNTEAASFAESISTTHRESALAHELGHNFGDWHTSNYDKLGNKTAEYASAFDPLHGPIMGVDYDGVVHKWTYWHRSLSDATGKADAAALQDDMAYIAADLNTLDGPAGDGYRPDGYAGTIAAATPLTMLGNTQAAIGIIERLTDVDAFSFDSSGGTYNIAVGRHNPSGVDVKVSIYDSLGALIASEDGDPRAQPYKMVNDSELALNLAPGTYYILVESHGNYGDQGEYVARVAQDIGLTGVPGFAGYDAATGTYTVAGSGADIWGGSDGFQYAFQTLSGSGSITALVTSMDDTSVWAKAGIMIRDTLADNSREAYLVMTPHNGPQWSWRNTIGGNTGSTTPATNTNFTPKWLRIVRNGNTFTAFTAPIGGTFTQIGASQVVPMGSTVQIGLAVSAVNNGQLNKATFTEVSLTGTLNPPPVLNGLPAPADLSIISTTYNSVALSWSLPAPLVGDTNGDNVVNSIDYDNLKSNWLQPGLGDVNGDGIADLADFVIIKANQGNTGPSGYRIERSTDNVNFAQVGTTSLVVNTFTDSSLSDGQRYFYRLRASSASSVSTSSEAITATTRAGAIANLNVISYSPTQLVLDWKDASGESSYRIERSDDGVSGWTSLGTNAKNVPIFNALGLTASTKHYFRVVTLDAGGDSATSAVAKGYTRLPVVTGLTFTTKASNLMAIQWNAVAGVTSYTVYRSTDGATFSALASNILTTTYADNAVTPLGEYYYRVVAFNANTQGVDPAAIFAAAPALTTLPSPWVSQDLVQSAVPAPRASAAEPLLSSVEAPTSGATAMSSASPTCK